MKSFRQQIKRRLSPLFFVGMNGAVVVGISTLHVGRALFLTSGLVGGGIALFLCCVLVYSVSSSVLSLSYNFRAGILDIIQIHFGEKGTVFCAVIMALVFGLWFSVQLDALLSFLHWSPYVGDFVDKIPLLRFLMTFACFGLAWFEGLCLVLVSVICVPCILLLCIVMPVFFSVPEGNSLMLEQQSLRIFDLSIFAPLLSGLCSMIMATPTLYRFTRNREETLMSLKISYLILLPISAGCGLLLGYLSPNDDPLSISFFYDRQWSFVAEGYMILSAFTVNMMNLYFLKDTISQMFRARSRFFPFCLSAILCLFFVYQQDFVVQYLDFVNASLGAILTIIMFRSFKRFSSPYVDFKRDNVLSLVLSITILFFCRKGDIQMTRILFFDGIIISAFLCFYFTNFSRHPSSEYDFNLNRK